MTTRTKQATNSQQPRKTVTRKVASLMEGKNKNLYIKFEKPVTITTHDGKKVETLYLNLDKPTDVLNRLLQNGIIDESAYEQRMEKLEALPFLKYEVSASVPKD